jgi:molybdate transport system ATP-binding protein
LSGGQQQRVALARILAYEPDVLLLDEPFSALDAYLKEQLQTEILEFLQYYHGEVLMVTHSKDEVYKFCNNLAIIDEGNTILIGKTKEIFAEPKKLKAARLIGCKNISKCKIVSHDYVYATEWGVNIKTNKKITQNPNYIGVSSKDFDIVHAMEDNNTIECNIIKVIEEIFEYTLVLEIIGGSENSKIYFNIGKDKWHNESNEGHVFLRIKEDSFYLLQ